MRGRARCLTIAGVLATAVMTGQAVGDVRVAEHQFQHDEPASSDGWRELPADERGDAGDVQIVAGYRHTGSGAVLAITRMAIANPRAWRDDDDFFAEVEAGIESTTAGYQRFHRRQQRVNKVPAFDLGFRRDTERAFRALLESFAPYLPAP